MQAPAGRVAVFFQVVGIELGEGVETLRGWLLIGGYLLLLCPLSLGLDCLSQQ